MGVIVTAIAVSAGIGGILIRLADPRSFPSIGAAVWWALQTVTTVGYGDKLPESALGRLVAAFFMVEAVAFLSIVTAVITSSFVERAQRERIARVALTEPDDAAQLPQRLDEVSARLDRIERALAQLASREAGPD
jgi:voltage-gated potassium channel